MCYFRDCLYYVHFNGVDNARYYKKARTAEVRRRLDITDSQLVNIIKEMKLSHFGSHRKTRFHTEKKYPGGQCRGRERKEGKTEKEISDWLENNIMEIGRQTIHMSECRGIIRVSALTCQR